MSDLRQVRARRQRQALEILAGEPDGLTGRQLWARVVEVIPLGPDEEGYTKDGRTPRARVTWYFQTSKMTQAGWLAKAGDWRVTEKGLEALKRYPDPVAFTAAADEAYQEFRAMVRPGHEQSASAELLGSLIVPARNEALIGQASRLILDDGLGQGDSFFSPGSGAWGPDAVEDLHTRYVVGEDLSDRPFMEKLHDQLEGAPDETIVLAAEIVALLTLPLANLVATTKRDRMRTILSWMDQPVTIPREVAAAFMYGTWHGGMGGNMLLWKAMANIVEFVRAWWQLSEDDRSLLLDEPWEWAAHLDSSEQLTMPSTKEALKYLAFPTHFLPIVKVADKEKIREGFQDRLASATGDLDKDLFAITTSLQVESAAPVEYYQQPWFALWDPEGAKVNRRAWLIRGSSVSGVNLVPHWLVEGFVSLPAKSLPEIDLPTSRDAISSAVEQGYANRNQTYRRSKLDDYDRFLRRMAPGDALVTTSEGMVYVGELVGRPAWDDESALPARLRRDVAWRDAETGVAFADLPDPLPARLGAPGDIVDLTELIELIDGLSSEPGAGEGGSGEGDNSGSTPDDSEVDTRARVGRPVILPPPGADLAEKLYIPQEWLAGLVSLLNRRRQVILYGPPGTGKTFVAHHLAQHLTEPGDTALVQFHPSYAYEDFVMGYRPVKSDAGVAFELKPGPLMRIAEQARDNRSVPHFLIIDEINRANLAKVFGELYFLLEYRDKSVQLLYSEDGTEDFFLPDNLFLIGTMNTADRSIALVDAAMRRRFAFKELHPNEPPVDAVLGKWLTANGHGDDAARLLDALNARIDDRDFRIGPSYLMRDWIYTEPDGLSEVWQTDLLPLLEEHHAGDGTDVRARYGLPTLMRTIGIGSHVTGDQPLPGPLNAQYVLISPSGFGHLDGCPHPGPDPDLTHWGRVDGGEAWPALLAGGTLASTGPNLGLEARQACSDCVARYNAGQRAGTP